MLDVPLLRRIWAELRTLPEVDEDAMCHRDLIPPNVLVEGGRLIGLLDGGGFGPADPALDLVAAWHLLDETQRDILRRELGCGDVQCWRGMAWAFQQAMGLVWYYRDSNPTMSRWGRRTLDRIVDAWDARARRIPLLESDRGHDAPLARAALCMAIAVRGGDVAGVIFHTDQGGEYTGELFANACTNTGVRQSMGRTGSALDNAAAESFHSTVEFELLRKVHFATRVQARRQVASYIEDYDLERRHSTCAMRSPVAYERLKATGAAA